ncbi:MAG: alpha/beta hydrolase [Actinomycetota bacterium]|nr:alpha/beta hydrolase [Actinomycetota bacterium]
MPFATNARDGSQVYFEDAGGDGTPVVILGGFLDPIDLVRRAPIAQALQTLSREFRLLYVDHRGHGRSAKPHEAEAYAMPLRVADAVAVLDELAIERANFIGISWGGRLCFGIGEYAPERVRSLVIIGQQPYAIEPGGPLARVVGEALNASREHGIEALVEAFEVVAGRYPEPVRATYLGCDAAAMRAAWSAVMSEGAVSEDLGGWDVRCLVCVAVGDADFFDQARRAAEEIPDAEFVPIDGTDHLGMDTAEVDPILASVLRMLRESG